MANTPNQNPTASQNADETTDVTRSQNRQAAAASHEDNPPMGTATEDTGSRPSNDNKDNRNSGNPHQNQTGSHREGQYPRNNENNNLQDVSQAQAAQQESNPYNREAHRESEGLIGKPGDKPE